MSIQLQEIKNIFIKNRLTEGVDFKRYEWLKGRNGAYINTNYYPIVGTDVFSVHFAYDGTMRNPDGVEQCIFGTMSSYNYIRAYISSSGTLSCNYFYNKKLIGFPSTRVISNEWEINDLMLNGSNYQFTANGVTYSFSNNDIQSQVLSTPILVFKSVQQVNSNCYFHGDIASFKITDTSFNTKMDLIPCQLLRSIPASLDANNIARSAGECGMYDSVSGKFYGNVVSTGTFTVEGEVEPENNSGLQQIYQNKLIDGVDYETADWLKYTDWVISESENALYGAYLICNLKVTTILKLTIKLGETILNLHNVDVELIVRSSTRIYYIRRNYYDNYVYLYNSASTIISGPHNLGSKLDFSITEEGLFINDVHLINEKIEYITQISSIGRSCTGSISSVTTGEGVDVLVPCKLLRSIPRNLDAQCKERQAGECGMIDLISGKFYGNMANSGTFTVENDNN